MTAKETNNALRERIKELTCLYDISAIAVAQNTLPDTLQAIAERLSLAWQYNDRAVVAIHVNEKLYLSGQIPSENVKLQEVLPLENVNGDISVFYPSPDFKMEDFLNEEHLLLQKVAHEVASIADRFQRQAQEEAMRRTIERNDRLNILGEITAGVAHELNTPLGNILGFSEFISENAEHSQQKKDADKITSSALYAREVVKKLMFFSCDMPQRMESIAINPLVADAIKLMAPKLQKEGISIEFSADPMNPFGQLDPIQITQVVFNMLLNAIHASEAGSTISVSLQSSEKLVNITIEDQGHGIPARLHDKIFEPFFTTKGVGQGSGLGLSVVHGIVKSHRGAIRFSTEEGVGTTFNISLPVQT